MRSHRLPQKIYNAGENGSILKCSCTKAARPSMDLRMSVYPQAIYISLAAVMSPNIRTSVQEALPPQSAGLHLGPLPMLPGEDEQLQMPALG